MIEDLHRDRDGADIKHRLLLAQDDRTRLVGVDCPATDLSDRFTRDRANRALYCFVGWIAPLGRRLPLPPALPELRAHVRSLAGPVYEDIVGPVWEDRDVAVSRPVTTEPAAAPWTSEPADGPARLPAPGQWPVTRESELWNSLALSRTPAALAIGFDRPPTPRRSADGRHLRWITHLTATEVGEYRPWPIDAIESDAGNATGEDEVVAPPPTSHGVRGWIERQIGRLRAREDSEPDYGPPDPAAIEAARREYGGPRWTARPGGDPPPDLRR